MAAKTVSRILVLTIAISLTAFSLARASGFTADLVQIEKGSVKKSRFYYLNPSRYRIDTVEKGQELQVLVDRRTGTTRIMAPASKVFVEMDNTSMVSLMENPFESFFHISQQHKPRPQGHQVLEGLECEKRVITDRGKPVLVAWIALEYDFPIRIESPSNLVSVQLRNINGRKLDPADFAVPPGFKKVARLPAAIPAWAKDIQAADLLQVPFTRELGSGGMIKIAPMSGYWLMLTVSNAHNGSSRFTAVAFKGGRPIIDTSFKTYTIRAKGQKLHLTEKAGPGEADLLVIRVAKGRIKIDARLEPARRP